MGKSVISQAGKKYLEGLVFNLYIDLWPYKQIIKKIPKISMIQFYQNIT